MATNNSLKPERVISIPQIEQTEVIQDVKFFGFNIKLNWSYADPRILLFKVFRFKLPTPLLERSYDVSQVAFERLASINQFETKNTVLFNKSAFSRNSFVNFFQSGSTRFDKKEEDVVFYDFNQIGIVRKNASGLYEFVDRNVKFGETYSYAISAFGKNFINSKPSQPVNVNVEDVKVPLKPLDIKVRQANKGSVLFLGTNEPIEVKSFLIYRKEEHEDEFEFLFEVEKNLKDKYSSFLDLSLEPGKEYIYKVHTVDLFDNVSYEASYKSVYNRFMFPNKNSETPRFTIKNENGFNRIEIKKDPAARFCRVKRQDAWRREKGFTFKTNRGIEWKSSIEFISGSVIFDDLSAKIGKIYKYQITLIDKNGIDLKSFITPHLKINKDLNYSSFEGEEEALKNNGRFISVSATPIDEYSIKKTLKLSWLIDGAWDYLVINLNGKKFLQVESFHTAAYLFNLEESNINISIELYYKNEMIDSREDIILAL